MTDDNSDYNRPFQDLNKLLPDPYQSDVNNVLFHNLFNRFLTKQETEQVAGYIGEGNFDAVERRQIREFNVHRQANQLQPLLYEKIGSVEWISSWKDLLAEAERLGIDEERIPEWLNIPQFNWVPPIDIDKLINYRNYFWYDPENPTSPPQYITIESRCQTATSRVNFLRELIDVFGSTFTITEARTIDQTLPTFDIVSIDNKTITVKGDATDLQIGHFFTIRKTNNNDGVYQVQTSPSFVAQDNATTITIDQTLETQQEQGEVRLRLFDKFVVDDNVQQLFEPNFTFTVTNTNNTELSNQTFTVVESSLNKNGRTIIQIETAFTNKDVKDATISLDQKLQQAINDRDCLCDGAVGWDLFQWDDNPEDPLWDGSHSDLIESISNEDPPPQTGTENQLWWDTSTDQLFQYKQQDGWTLLWSSFSAVVEQTEGRVLWDLTPACGETTIIPAGDQWVRENKWLHKSDVPSFSIAKQASIPIIEFDWDLEINEWLVSKNTWKYRASTLDSFETVDEPPFLIELFPLDLWEISADSNHTIIFDERYGNMTEWFINGAQFLGVDQSDILTVESSEYRIDQTDGALKTYVYVDRNVSQTDIQPGDIANVRRSPTGLRPLLTSQGDVWQGYGVHWLFDSKQDSKSVTHKPSNPRTIFNDNEPFFNDEQSGLEVDVRYTAFAKEYTIVSEPDFNPDQGLRFAFGLSAPSFTYNRIDSSGTIEVTNDVTDQFIEGVLVTIANSSTNHGIYIVDQVEFDINSNSTLITLVNNVLTPTETPGQISPLDVGTYRRLTHRALLGFNDTRVYINGIRQYGNYDELEDTIVPVDSITYSSNNDTFDISLPTDMSDSELTSGDFIRYEQDTVVNSTSLEVISISNNVITVSPSTTVDLQQSGENGVIYGLTQPITDVDEGVSFVGGIEFAKTVKLEKFDVVTVEVGEGSTLDMGLSNVPVRMDSNDSSFEQNGTQTISLIEYKKSEQVKTRNNQFPRFDIYNVDGTDAFESNNIFGYNTSKDADINSAVGQRIVRESTLNNFEFEAKIVKDDESLLAYRDYSNNDATFWYNPEEQTMYAWTGLTWSNRLFMGDRFEQILVAKNTPQNPFDGQLWFNQITKQLFEYVDSEWVRVEQTIAITNTDPTIQTIWRRDNDNKRYQPVKRDWNMRTEQQYNDEKDLFIENKSNETGIDHEQAVDLWFDKQKEGAQELSPTGEFVGDWEIPEPLYHNHMHENRQIISSRELLTHFTSIVNNQNKIPGFIGRSSDMFRLISSDETNYGAGGTIKEHDEGFDNFLSSLFVNDVTPVSLIEFANQQYENQLNSMLEFFRNNAVDLLSDTSSESFENLSGSIIKQSIDAFEQNTREAFIYGDTTSFTENSGQPDTGIRNWIATLPRFDIVEKVRPAKIRDVSRGVNDIIHHDGHRFTYELEPAIIQTIGNSIVNAPDPRTNGADTFGRTSNTQPPNDIDEFETSFNTQIDNRQGVYWQNGVTLYRLNVVNVGQLEPSSSLADGTLWVDTNDTQRVLKQKDTDPVTETVRWLPVPGVTIGDGRLHNGSDPDDLQTASISAWQEIDVQDILTDIIIEVEQKLYDNLPDEQQIVYPFEQLEQDNKTLFNRLMEQRFLLYTNRSQIQEPFLNTEFRSDQPFTWNYKRSTLNKGFVVIEADGDTNSFVVNGNQVSVFDLCSGEGSCPSQTEFFVKNSRVNDGTWKTVQSTEQLHAAEYDPSSDTTTIYVEDNVIDSLGGIIYKGTLPSPQNDGSESGGDWRDLYTKMYNTPYPHLEPWKLQGYTGKPDWWDLEYLNDNATKWGDRRWKYRHGFDIVDVDSNNNQFFIDGDFVELFITGKEFLIDNSLGTHNGQWKVGTLTTINNVVVSDRTSFVDIDGDFESIIQPEDRFSITDQNDQLVTTLTAKTITFQGPPDNVTTIEVFETVDPESNNQNISGVLYKEQSGQSMIQIDSTVTPPLTSTVTSSTVEGRIAEAFGMWGNINKGTIPAGRTYSNGVESISGDPEDDFEQYGLTTPSIPTYNYFSVNIMNNDVSSDRGNTVFKPDDVFPPFWNFVKHFDVVDVNDFDKPVRSLFSNFTREIMSPSGDYSFGDSGPTEWGWRTSSTFLYDKLIVSFQIDPVRVLNRIFGNQFFDVNGLSVLKDTSQVFGHNRVKFHGEIENDTPLTFNGINQWYVNYNRFVGLDATFADFRSLWAEWTAPLMYQFSSFIDTQSLQLSHKDVNVSNVDYQITSKRAFGVEDYWIHTFNLSILDIPPSVSRFDNQDQWRFELQTPSVINQPIKYYDVHNYQFYVNPGTNTCTLYTYSIKDVNTVNGTFTVPGDQSFVLSAQRTFTVSESTGNNGQYTIERSTFDPVEKHTVVEVSDLIDNTTADGIITADYRTHPWETGDSVIFTSEETLPSPLRQQNDGVNVYFIIVVDNKRFKVARTQQDAINNVPIDFTTSGRGNSFVGQLNSTFRALGGQRVSKSWKHFAVDPSTELELMPPTEIQGIQNLINILDGYDVALREQGWMINEDNSLQDFENDSRSVSWQLEAERFIDFIYGLRQLKRSIPDQNQVEVDNNTNTWTFIDNQSSRLVTGDSITIFSTSGVFPEPLSRGTRYYIIRDGVSDFRIAASKRDARKGNEINIGSTTGIDQLFISPTNSLARARPTFEINPLRNGIWFSPERGIVSDTHLGTNIDARSTQILFDQFGRPLSSDDVFVFREDKLTSIKMNEQISNDMQPNIDNNPYNYLHIGGAHLFIDTLEHVLRFNNYSSDGQLLYDPFLGLNVTKYDLQYLRQNDFTQRPNVGGYYLLTENNQNGELFQNFESNVENIRFMYDTHTVSENTKLTTNARKSIGFERDDVKYLDLININDKSKFLFWQGMIQQKGSVNAIKSFINTRRFIDANVDDFWAIKLAEFGSNQIKQFPELWLTTSDSIANQLRLEYTEEGSIDSDDCDPGYDETPYDLCGFQSANLGDNQSSVTGISITEVSSDNTNRWFEQPDQNAAFRKVGTNMFFDVDVKEAIDVQIINSNEPPSNPKKGDSWIRNADNNERVFERFDGGSITEHGRWDESSNPIIRHNMASDDISITVRKYEDGHFVSTTIPSTFDIVSTSPNGGGNGEITVQGDQQKWFNKGDKIQITSTIAEGSYTISATPSVVNDNTVLLVEYISDTGNDNGITTDISGSGILKTGSVRQLTIDPYIALTDSITVFKDGIQLERDQEYTEALPENNEIFSTTIIFPEDVNGSTIDVIYDVSTLNSDIHFTQINANIVQINSDQLIASSDTEHITLWGLIVDQQTHNPAQIIDKETDIIISPVQIWDPARGFHYANALNTIDLIDTENPAVYSNTFDQSVSSTGIWGEREVGTTWLDMSVLDYKPYYDTVLFSTLSERINSWGELADWASVNIYQWVESDVPPEQWNDIAEEEETNGQIPQQQRKSGRVDQTLFVMKNNQWVRASRKVDQYDVILDQLESNTDNLFSLKNIDVEASNIKEVNSNEKQIILDDNFKFVLVPGMKFVVQEDSNETVYTIAATEFTEQESTLTVEADEDSITASPGDNVAFIDLTNIYVNGTIKKENAVLVPEANAFDDQQRTTVMLDVNINFNDRVVLEQSLPTNQDVIDHLIEQGKLLQGYEFSTSTTISSLGNEQTTYYFWVRDKVTRGNNLMSPAQAMQTMTNIPEPFMFTQSISRQETTQIDQQIVELPLRYRQAIVKGLRGFIDANQRFVLRFTRDRTLRDVLEDDSFDKNLHNEWQLIRENQIVNIPRWLWNQVTESIIGHALNDSSIRVPSLNRELYDEMFGTSTRFGLEQKQAFCNGEAALDILLQDLRSSDNDFSPIDIDTFFERNDFDTDQGIINAMSEIYNTFAFTHVNRIFFKILLNAALTEKTKYEGIIKTSMLSLFGVKPFQVSGVFDD